jgi:ATP-binding cassette subfamily C protein CydC
LHGFFSALPNCSVGAAGSEQLTKNLASLRINVLDLVGGLREIRAFGAEGRILARVQAADATLLRGQMRLARKAAFANAAAFLSGQIAIFLILLAVSGLWFFKVTPIAGVGVLFLTVAAFESAATLTRAGLQAGAMGSLRQTCCGNRSGHTIAELHYSYG